MGTIYIEKWLTQFVARYEIRHEPMVLIAIFE